MKFQFELTVALIIIVLVVVSILNTFGPVLFKPLIVVGWAQGSAYFTTDPTDRLMFPDTSYTSRVGDPVFIDIIVRFPYVMSMSAADCGRIGGTYFTTDNPATTPNEMNTCDVYRAVRVKSPSIRDSNGDEWSYARFDDGAKELIITRRIQGDFYESMGPSGLIFDFKTTPPEPPPPEPECEIDGDCPVVTLYVENGRFVPRCTNGECSSEIVCNVGYSLEGQECVPIYTDDGTMPLELLLLAVALIAIILISWWFMRKN